MVEIKIRKGEIGKVNKKVDVEFNGNILEAIATIIELESAVCDILTKFEDSEIDVVDAFLENIKDHFYC